MTIKEFLCLSCSSFILSTLTSCWSRALVWVAVDTEAHVRLIAELAPALLSIVQISSGVYVRLDTKASLASAMDRVLSLQTQSLLLG